MYFCKKADAYEMRHSACVPC